MITSTKKTGLFFLLSLLCFSSLLFTNAQDKELTFNQVYMFGEPRILKSLPRLQGWFDDENYLVQKRDATTSAIVKVDVKSGNETVVLDFNDVNKNLGEAEFFAEDNRMKK